MERHRARARHFGNGRKEEGVEGCIEEEDEEEKIEEESRLSVSVLGRSAPPQQKKIGVLINRHRQTNNARQRPGACVSLLYTVLYL
jgi:hypothetical protein